MKVAIDAMGGDRAPELIVEGAVEASRAFGSEIIFVGDQDKVGKALEGVGYDPEKIEVHHASQHVENDETPVLALRRKKDASILVAMRLVKEGAAGAVVSAGSTGAVMVAAKTVLGGLEGIIRPAIAALIPNHEGVCILLDAGANVDAKPQHLVQFAVMGSVFAQQVLGTKSPKVGLLNIGEEEGKGNEATKAAHEILRKSSKLNFVGNVEGRDLTRQVADVVVCDGFVGNILLKAGEGFAEAFALALKEELSKGLWSEARGNLSLEVLKRFRRAFDYREYGGAPLLGVKGVVIICHGSSPPKAIMNAVREAEASIDRELNEHIIAWLKEDIALRQIRGMTQQSVEISLSEK